MTQHRCPKASIKITLCIEPEMIAITCYSYSLVTLIHLLSSNLTYFMWMAVLMLQYGHNGR